MTETAAMETRDAPAAGGPAVVATQGLVKVFKDFWMRDRARAVDNLTFQINPGEIFGLLGPNGSGKSTTIKILLGLLRPTRGRVQVFGKAPNDVAVKRRIGYLPEESYLYGFLNAYETLDYYGKLFDLDAKTRRARIEELLDMVGLQGARFRPVREYSKGMQRRIGLAQALINDPELLILDEPTTGLDPIGTRQVKDLIIELGRRGKTILLSSHLLADVEDVVDRMTILYGGQKRDEGTCDELLTRAGTTTIEADELDDATIAEIDRIIRERTGGQKAIQRVTKPRQKLEELFVGIVQRAQEERADTSGAQAGGGTASFLKAETSGPDEEGAALIDALVTDEPAPPSDDVAAAERPADTQDVQPGEPAETAPAALIDNLVSGDPEPEVPEAAPHAGGGGSGSAGEPGASEPGESDVDDSVISSLLNPDADDEKPAQGGDQR